MFVSRRRRGPDPWLPWKMALFVVGGLLALLGMRLDDRWLLLAATVVLAVAFLLRFLRPDDDAASARRDDAASDAVESDADAAGNR